MLDGNDNPSRLTSTSRPLQPTTVLEDLGGLKKSSADLIHAYAALLEKRADDFIASSLKAFIAFLVSIPLATVCMLLFSLLILSMANDTSAMVGSFTSRSVVGSLFGIFVLFSGVAFTTCLVQLKKAMKTVRSTIGELKT